MSRLQCFVWISVMAASAQPQKGHPTFWESSRSITFPDTDHQSYHPRQSSQEYVANVQDDTKQKIQNRVSIENIQLTKRGGQVHKLLSKLVMELFSALGALPAAGDRVVFPGDISGSRSHDIPEDCKRLGYCENAPNYPEAKVLRAVNLVGDAAKDRFQVDVLDKKDVQITQRLGEDDGTEFAMELCNATEKISYPKYLKDVEDSWWPVAQLEKQKLMQGFRVHTCNTEDSCDSDITPKKGYYTKCVQKFMYRTVWAVDHNDQMVRRQLKLPTCCSCIIIERA